MTKCVERDRRETWTNRPVISGGIPAAESGAASMVANPLRPLCSQSKIRVSRTVAVAGMALSSRTRRFQ